VDHLSSGEEVVALFSVNLEEAHLARNIVVQSQRQIARRGRIRHSNYLKCKLPSQLLYDILEGSDHGIGLTSK
jgi:hypothetical protein